MQTNQLKQKLKEGACAVGMFVDARSCDLVEIIGLSGYDFIVIDGEHAPTGPEGAVALIRTAELSGLTPVVRVPGILERENLQFLDVGAHGIQAPQVNSREDADRLVRMAKYAPLGSRGVAFARSAGFGLRAGDDYFERANQQGLLIAQCENVAGLERLEEICACPQVDVVFMGPYDLSQSMGITGQVTHAKIEQAAERVLAVTRAYGKAAGIYVGDGQAAARRAAQGFRYITIGMDTGMFAAKCSAELAAFRQG